MRGAGWGRWAAALGSAAALFVLLSRWAIPPAGTLGQAAGDSAHVLIFAGLAWLWGRVLPAPWRGWRLWGGMLVMAGAVEGLQAWGGRSAEGMDWMCGAGGAACVCFTWGARWRGWIRWTGVLVLCALPPAWVLAMRGMECRSFPVLADRGACWARRGWELNGVRLSTSSGLVFRIERVLAGRESVMAYPGVFRAPAWKNWRGLRSWGTTLYWPGPASAVFAVRVDDRAGDPPYAERFQREFVVTQGWNAVEISAEEMSRTSGGRPLRLDQVRSWGLFLVSDAPFDYFLIGETRLHLNEDRP